MVVPKNDEIVPGVLLRMVERDPECLAPFSDSVVVSVKDGNVKLARPYLYATLTETACPGWLTGVEEYTVPMSRVLSRFWLVAQDRGQPHIFKT